MGFDPSSFAYDDVLTARSASPSACCTGSAGVVQARMPITMIIKATTAAPAPISALRFPNFSQSDSQTEAILPPALEMALAAALALPLLAERLGKPPPELSAIEAFLTLIPAGRWVVSGWRWARVSLALRIAFAGFASAVAGLSFAPVAWLRTLVAVRERRFGLAVFAFARFALGEESG